MFFRPVRVILVSRLLSVMTHVILLSSCSAACLRWWRTALRVPYFTNTSSPPPPPPHGSLFLEQTRLLTAERSPTASVCSAQHWRVTCSRLSPGWHKKRGKCSARKMNLVSFRCETRRLVAVKEAFCTRYNHPFIIRGNAILPYLEVDVFSAWIIIRCWMEGLPPHLPNRHPPCPLLSLTICSRLEWGFSTTSLNNLARKMVLCTDLMALYSRSYCRRHSLVPLHAGRCQSETSELSYLSL